MSNIFCCGWCQAARLLLQELQWHHLKKAGQTRNWILSNAPTSIFNRDIRTPLSKKTEGHFNASSPMQILYLTWNWFLNICSEMVSAGPTNRNVSAFLSSYHTIWKPETIHLAAGICSSLQQHFMDEMIWSPWVITASFKHFGEQALCRLNWRLGQVNLVSHIMGNWNTSSTSCSLHVSGLGDS